MTHLLRCVWTSNIKYNRRGEAHMYQSSSRMRNIKNYSFVRKTHIGHPCTTEFTNVHATTASGSGQSGGPPTPDRTDGGQLQLSQSSTGWTSTRTTRRWRQVGSPFHVLPEHPELFQDEGIDTAGMDGKNSEGWTMADHCLGHGTESRLGRSDGSSQS